MAVKTEKMSVTIIHLELFPGELEMINRAINHYLNYLADQDNDEFEKYDTLLDILAEYRQDTDEFEKYDTLLDILAR